MSLCLAEALELGFWSQSHLTERSMSARAAASLGLFKRAGLSVDFSDAVQWHVMPAPSETDRVYLFWPASGNWKRPDGSLGAGGARKLIEEIRQAASSHGQP
jgi:hypothetical protein